MMRRRSFLRDASLAAAGVAVGRGFEVATQVSAGLGGRVSLVVDPAPLFELSPYLYMQFMEPLGATDGSVERPPCHGRSRAINGARTWWRLRASSRRR